MANGGISIPVKAETVAAMRDLNNLGRAAQGLGKNVQGAFGNNQNRALRDWNRDLERAERNLQRLTQRLREQHAVQATLVQQQRQLRGLTNPTRAQQERLLRLPAMIAGGTARTRGLATRVQDARAEYNGLQGSPPTPPGPLTTVMGVAGTVAKAVGAAAVSMAVAEFYQGFRMDDSDQRMLADLLPRTRMGRLKGTNTQTLANRMREFGGMGFSGTEALGVAGTMSTVGGDFGKGLERDTAAMLAMGRFLGLNPQGEAQIFSQSGKMGAFQPGQAHVAARMLAAEIAHTGLGPRAAEVQDATLRLLNQQMSTMSRVNLSTALAVSGAVGKGGPSWLGAQGAGLLSTMDNAIKGARDEAGQAFIQATARDQFGISGLGALKRFQEEGILGKPGNLGAYVNQAFRVNGGNYEAATQFLSTQMGIPLHKLDALNAGLPGGLAHMTKDSAIRDQGRIEAAGLHFDLAGRAGETMGMTGNQLRKGEARIHNKAADAADETLRQFAIGLNKAASGLEWLYESAAGLAAAWGGYQAAGRPLSKKAKAYYRSLPAHPYRGGRGGVPRLPDALGLDTPGYDPAGMAAAPYRKLERPPAPVVHHHHHEHKISLVPGPLAPQIQQQFVAAVKTAMTDLHEQRLGALPHHRRVA